MKVSVSILSIKKENNLKELVKKIESNNPDFIHIDVMDGEFVEDTSFTYNETKDILNSMGADKNTIFLSCGIGDIILTCTSSNSRNYTLGFMIGSGVSSKDIGNYLSNNTVEGINALKSFKTSNGLVNLINDIIYNGSSSYELLNYILK